LSRKRPPPTHRCPECGTEVSTPLPSAVVLHQCSAKKNRPYRKTPKVQDPT